MHLAISKIWKNTGGWAWSESCQVCRLCPKAKPYSNSTILLRLPQIAADEVRRRVGVTAKVRTGHGQTTEEILQACREGPNAAAREEPKAPAAPTQRLGAADIRPSVVPLDSQLPSDY